MLKNLPEGTEAHLCLLHDSASKERAQKIEKRWLGTLQDKKLVGKTWLFFSNKKQFLERGIVGQKSRYIELSNDEIKNLDTNLSSNIIWYIKNEDKYYLYSKEKQFSKEKKPPKSSQETQDRKIPMTLKESTNSPNLQQKQCYFSLNQSDSDSSKYPRYVFNLNNNNLSYYKDENTLLQSFTITQKNMRRLNSLIGKGKSQRFGPIIILSPRELGNISDLISYIPKEILITAKEFEQITNTLKGQHIDLEAEMRVELKWREFTKLTRTLDLFIMAGWSHSHTPATAEYLKVGLEIPLTCKIVLTSVPGMSVNANKFVTGIKDEQQYPKVYVLQPGIKASGGFPILPTLTKKSIESQQARDKWTSHIRPHIKDYDLCMNKEGEEGKDKLVVIYCSKDKPGMSGTKFLQTVADKINPEEYAVLLIGANKETEEYLEWENLCNGYNFKSCVAIQRTESSEILMRGLRDAEFSMATGSYSILEARYLDVHCEYLCPPHMEQLGTMLRRSSKESIKNAFAQGQRALDELSRVPLEDYNGTLFDPHCAWDNKTLGWQKFLVESQLNEESKEVQIDSSSFKVL